MPKKKKKSILDLKLILWVILLLAILVGIFELYDYQKENAVIKEANKFFYDSLLCISNCPSVMLLGTNPLQVIFDEDCTDSCRVGAQDIAKKLEGIELNGTRIIVNSQELVICRQSFESEGNAEKYKVCLKQALPGLKDRFDIQD